MVTVITYGTYDLLHYGHIRLLERAKALGDYLIVGVTADDFDKTRGKINVQQSLMERIEAIRATGLADKIIVEEYEGQKIDDIIKYNVDIFTVGSDWVGKFDYLNAYCKVQYLPRTEGVSSSELRAEKSSLKLGLVGETVMVEKYFKESHFVNGVEISAVFTSKRELLSSTVEKSVFTETYEELLEKVDAVYISSHPTKHYEHIKIALEKGRHVLCESPIALTEAQCMELFELAKEKGLILMDALKTAYATAYNRLLVMLKSGKVGRIVSVDATCTSLRDIPDKDDEEYSQTWNSICSWGPTALLPIFQILGTDWEDMNISSLMFDKEDKFDLFTRINFRYKDAVASVNVGKGVKSESELIVTGTKGYVFVPAPWWKTDYFELRFEFPENNRRYYYHLEGEGIRYELFAFVMAIKSNAGKPYITQKISGAISKVLESYNSDNVDIIE
ncbi:MAG: Gfo/Idh/MocA family oxidoreductase [Ruminococcus sp.]